MKLTMIVLTGLVLVATAAFAHKNVKNPAVMARMEAMSAIAANMKTLGNFAKGATPFEATKARAAAQSIAGHAAETAQLFAIQEDDPKSEALPSIWQNLDDFLSKSKELETLATQYSTSIETLTDVKSAMSALGATCKSCHSDYRKKR